MRYHCLATDYDGTLAHDGKVSLETVDALHALRGSGRKLVLVTGRELVDLLAIFPELNLFDLVVAENGGVLYRPGDRQEKPLAAGPPERFIAELDKRGVAPISVGRVVVATWDNHRVAVLETIEALGLELQMIFNKGALMVLPSGVNKATGLAVALGELGLSVRNTVGVGDAENDHAFLSVCECAVAVANALPALKEKADIVTKGDHGSGVVELIKSLLESDLASAAPRLSRHDIPIGESQDRAPVLLPAYGENILAAGHSGSGKSTFATGLIERLADRNYQLCIIDPEGDYTTLPHLLNVGDEQSEVTAELVLDALRKPLQNVNANFIGVTFKRRAEVFLSLFSRLQIFRSQTGRPQWLVIDEAHHVFPRDGQFAEAAIPQNLVNTVLVTVTPNLLQPAIVGKITMLVAVGDDASAIVQQFASLAGWQRPSERLPKVRRGEALLWAKNCPPIHVRIAPAHTQLVRHARKYAAGELPPGREFHFRGPDGKLNLRAQNLMIFLQLADGVDDDTWMYHFRNGDYSQWFREAIQSDELANEVESIEQQHDLSPAESRALIRRSVESRFTMPAR